MKIRAKLSEKHVLDNAILNKNQSRLKFFNANNQCF